MSTTLGCKNIGIKTQYLSIDQLVVIFNIIGFHDFIISKHCDLVTQNVYARDWMLRLNAYIVHVVPARIMQL